MHKWLYVTCTMSNLAFDLDSLIKQGIRKLKSVGLHTYIQVLGCIRTLLLKVIKKTLQSERELILFFSCINLA